MYACTQLFAIHPIVSNCFGFQLVTDLDFGRGMDSVIKYHAPYESSYEYVWSYKSWDDYEPHWMGEYTLWSSRELALNHVVTMLSAQGERSMWCRR